MTEPREPGITTPSEDDEPQKRLSRRLREAREYLGLAQQFVADQTGIPRAAISAIETGRRRVEALELERLAGVYKFPVAYFLEGSLEEPASVRALAREAVELTEDDRAEVLRFAQFLKGFGESRPRPTRDRE
ncbi:MAG: helix-turn-helix transcriptional regulator [Chloroflexi bacterium]|nr:helix-turn-helix transcriptional regulator [Chloroflexota bacterium]